MANQMFLQPPHFISLIILFKNDNIISTAIQKIRLTFFVILDSYCYVNYSFYTVCFYFHYLGVLSRELCKNPFCFNYPLLIERVNAFYKTYYGQSF